jgi:hypothetical protein
MAGGIQRNVTSQRRLLLAKLLYLHALGHSKASPAVDKMIAVHNFHNAVEVVLRAILLEHEIRVENHLNLDFEALMNNIDQFELFKAAGQRLPYRTELRKLNSIRNLVQHHAHEPEESTMEEWRVFSHRFLCKAYLEYFGVDFDQMSLRDFIADGRLKQLLVLTDNYLETNRWDDAVCASKLAFHYASSSLEANVRIQDSSAFFASSRLDRGLREVVENLYSRIGAAESYAAILASGINAADFARYKRSPIIVGLIFGGGPYFQNMHGPVQESDALWVRDFVTDSILRWQNGGFGPGVPERSAAGCDKFLQQGFEELSLPKPGE